MQARSWALFLGHIRSPTLQDLGCKDYRVQVRVVAGLLRRSLDPKP